MEYVREKASLHELAKTVKAWERKVEIAEVWLILSAAHQEYYHIHFSVTDQIQKIDLFEFMVIVYFSSDGPEDSQTDMAQAMSTKWTVPQTAREDVWPNAICSVLIYSAIIVHTQWIIQ